MTKTTVVLLLAALVIPRLQRRSAAERHALWAASLAVAALVPLLSLWLPSWHPDWARRIVDVLPDALRVAPPPPSRVGDITIRATGVDASGWTLADLGRLVWVSGSSVVLVWLGVGALKLKRLVASAHRVTDAGTHQIAADLTVSLQSKSPVLLRSARVPIPVAWGVWRRPRILLPDASRDWSPERLRAVLAHEMAHVARGDWIAHLAAEVICAVYWFHPLFWMARNGLGRESERAADDVVIGLGVTGTDYATHLVEIVRAAGRSAPDLTATVAMARSSGLERRITAMLAVFVSRHPLRRGPAIAIVMTAALIAPPLASLGAGPIGQSIRIRTSDLPAIVDLSTRDVFGDDAGDPVSHIQLVGDSGPATLAPSVKEYTTPPLYSDEARQRGIEGTVTARAWIDAHGHVTSVRIVSGLGFGLDQNATVALRQWRFQPGTRSGVAQSMEVEVEIPFTLRSDAINAQIANDMVALVGPGVTPPQAVTVVNVPTLRVSARGSVVLDVVLLEDGTPRIVRILRSLGTDADEAAVRTFEQWRFSPAMLDGRPLKVRMNAEVMFHG